MLLESPLQLSQMLLAAMGTRTFTYYQNRIPKDSAVLVVSNHRSFMDAPLLMVALNQPIHFACHHYMGQVPILRELVARMGCFPLDPPHERQHNFFRQATELLQTQRFVGVFPEGTEPMVQSTSPRQLKAFHRGFAHLAMRAAVRDLAVLPVAIAATDEASSMGVPLRLLSLFDPSEPLFADDDWHPLVIYKRVNVLVGRPFWISQSQREHYQGKQARSLVADLTHQCCTEIHDLLHTGCK
ncbi:1-acyl-sn-glycerol-3-phosphate acyltransferase [Leptothermofonsia sichuanensis E412]|uniref:lysophospholipid acyltransferase family protein n=1 Tax=Leptothermofonsia sichuanensis TaxID=2917832 RepID=UPI001CA72321|nr:lysophospholipid acyltransferase family protein [Leptothermofonsia sichuanensis]QZZ19527.1 1-acyl-sn-glycerol-3-phosphate acyltransferase [Leptothermofonsia sichuanensis E412]